MSRLGTIRDILFNAFQNISPQYPMPIAADSVYAGEIDLENSDNGDFSGEVTDYFDSLKSVNVNTTSDNPKIIQIQFQRTTYSSAIGLGCDDTTGGGFGTSITIKLLGSGGVVRRTVDHTATSPFSTLIDVGSQAFNGIVLEFNTALPVSLSNITIRDEIETRSQIKAVKDNGDVVNIGATNNNNLRVSLQEFGDTGAIDAFGRLRSSQPTTIYDSKQLHDKSPLFWDEEVGGSATSVFSTGNSAVDMTVTANVADYVIRQTRQRFNYQPGKSQQYFFTFQASIEAGVTKRVGPFTGTGVNYLTPLDGIFFQVTDVLSWNIAKGGTTTETVLQADWNVDRMDGTGPSGITLDMDATQIAIIDFEWLGVGRVRAGFVIDGITYYCHYFNHANDSAFTSVYMSSPNLPLRYDIQSTGSAGSMSHICSTVMSEGGQEETGVLRSVENSSTFVAGYATGTKYALIGIKLQAAYPDITVLQENVKLVLGTNDSFKWELQLNPLVNGTFTYNPLIFSGIEYAQGTTANTIGADGIIIGAGGGSQSARGSADEFDSPLSIGVAIDETRDILVLAFQPLTANASVWAALNFRELL